MTTSDNPTDLGSGGGNNPGCNFASTGNAGGGALQITADALRLDGSIRADAAAPVAERLGGGAGGSILVYAGALIGEGSFSANGAAGGNSSSGGGGGGRIAVYYGGGAEFHGCRSSAADGGHRFVDGTPGSLLFVDSLCDGDCDGGGAADIDELLLAVSISLRGDGAEECSAADSDGDGAIDAGDLIRAVGRALRGPEDHEDRARGQHIGLDCLHGHVLSS